MSYRADKIRRRMKKRRQQRARKLQDWQRNNNINILEDEERYGFERISSYDQFEKSGRGNNLFNKDTFLFKLLISACLFLFVAIAFHTDGSSFGPARSIVKKTMTENFEFAAVSNWYESKFGKPLALLPPNVDSGTTKNDVKNDTTGYALPASATIVESFEKNGQGIMVETGIEANVEAMNEGIVRFAGIDSNHGKTVIIQHANKTETWYGNLDEINVNLFDFVKQGNSLGVVSKNSDETKGSFYFAIKQGGDFINPAQVIQFE